MLLCVSNMSHPATREFLAIQKELQRLNIITKKLRQQQDQAKQRVYRYMVAHNLEEIDGVTLKKVAPKEKFPRKKKSEKVNDALKLFRESGLTDPEGFWNELQKTQRYQKNEVR
jgi:hypothetical protein